MLTYSKTDGKLRRAPDLSLNPWNWTWQADPNPVPADAQAMSLSEAVAMLHGARQCRFIPVGVIGPRSADLSCLETAESLGLALGELGVPVLCGGKQGVMEAVARGVRKADGLSIGLIPENDWHAANCEITLPLATGIGIARNVLIAHASCALVAVGGQYGTISEVALGLQFEKPVFGLCGAPDIEGVQQKESVGDVVDALMPILLRLDVAS
jgi:uncharacterized protein (TIGR00725 family)